MGKVKELEDRLEREQRYYQALFEEKKELQAKLYGPLQKDELMKEVAVDFGNFLLTMNVKYVDFKNKLCRTDCGMAPDAIVESLGAMFDRFMSSKSGIY